MEAIAVREEVRIKKETVVIPVVEGMGVRLIMW